MIGQRLYCIKYEQKEGFMTIKAASSLPKHAGRRFDLFDSQGALAVALLLPSCLIIFGVLLFPMLSSLTLSFTDLKLTKPGSGRFIYFQNYAAAFANPLFWASVGRTAIFTVATVVVEVTLGLLVALLLNTAFRGRGFVRGLIILPWALPYVVNGIMWKWIFDANYGVLNAILTQAGLLSEYRIWLGDPTMAMAIVIVANIWKETPVAVILLLAALQGLPGEMVEAAAMDGAGKWTIFRKIVVPYLRPMIITLVVIKSIWALKEFDLLYIITKGGPANATNLFSYYIYQNSFQYLNFGYGAALAYILTILALLMSVSYMQSMKGELS